MRKRGFLDILLGTGIILLFLAGTLLIVSEYNVDVRYIGNKENKNLYDLRECPPKFGDIEENNIKTFSSLEDAKKEDYNLIEGCKK